MICTKNGLVRIVNYVSHIAKGNQGRCSYSQVLTMSQGWGKRHNGNTVKSSLSSLLLRIVC